MKKASSESSNHPTVDSDDRFRSLPTRGLIMSVPRDHPPGDTADTVDCTGRDTRTVHAVSLPVAGACSRRGAATMGAFPENGSAASCFLPVPEGMQPAGAEVIHSATGDLSGNLYRRILYARFAGICPADREDVYT